jgi:hypothetical protein
MVRLRHGTKEHRLAEISVLLISSVLLGGTSVAQLDRVHHPAVPPLHCAQQLGKLLHLPAEAPRPLGKEAPASTGRWPGKTLGMTFSSVFGIRIRSDPLLLGPPDPDRIISYFIFSFYLTSSIMLSIAQKW